MICLTEDGTEAQRGLVPCPKTTQADVDFKCKPYCTLTSVLSLDCPTSRQPAQWHWFIVILKGVHCLCRVPSLCFTLIIIIPCGEDPLCARHWVSCLHRPGYELPCMSPGRWGPHLVHLSWCNSWPSAEGLVHTQPQLFLLFTISILTA